MESMLSEKSQEPDEKLSSAAVGEDIYQSRGLIGIKVPSYLVLEAEVECYSMR